MSWQAAAFGSAVTALFILSLWKWRLESAIVSLILLMGWLTGQVIQQTLSYRELVEIFWLIDFASAMVLFGLFAAGMSWWVWRVASIYAFMVFGHWVLFNAIKYEWEWATDYNHWLYTSALFALQILIVFGGVYGKRETSDNWLGHVSQRLKNHFGSLQDGEGKT